MIFSLLATSSKKNWIREWIRDGKKRIDNDDDDDDDDQDNNNDDDDQEDVAVVTNWNGPESEFQSRRIWSHSRRTNVCLSASLPKFYEMFAVVRRRNTTEQTEQVPAVLRTVLIRRHDRVPLAAPIRLSRWRSCVGSIKTNRPPSTPCWINAVVWFMTGFGRSDPLHVSEPGSPRQPVFGHSPPIMSPWYFPWLTI